MKYITKHALTCVLILSITVCLAFCMRHADPTIWWLHHTRYAVSSEPIDVVIVCHKKDIQTLDLAIDGVKRYGKHIRRVITVSEERLTDAAEWFDESLYPFTKRDVAQEIFQDAAAAEQYMHAPGTRIGWIYQQLLKLYAPLIIPDISSNVLILDADTIFLHDVAFIDDAGNGLYNPGDEYYRPYFKYGKRLLLRFKKKFRQHSGISHHMLFQRAVIEDLLETITHIHRVEPWQALCRCINVHEVYDCPLSEYELYFNFLFTKTNQMKIRPLQWQNMEFDVQAIEQCQQEGFHYVACHNYFAQ